MWPAWLARKVRQVWEGGLKLELDADVEQFAFNISQRILAVGR